MAYSRRRTGRKSYRTASRATRSRSAARPAGRRRTTRGRSSGRAATRTVRLVIETAAPSQVQRAPMGFVQAKPPRQPSFG